jgi:predicted nucleic acid-binding protein
VIYFDSSALFKLVHDEPETGSLRQWLASRPDERLIASVLVEVEVERTVRRRAASALSMLPPLLGSIYQIEIDPTVRAIGARYQDPHLRSLDAIHMATAQHVAANSGIPLTAFVTYDKRLFTAAKDIGLPVANPGQS